MYKELKQRTVDFLKGKTLAGDNVLNVPTMPTQINAAMLPLVCVFIDSASAENLSNIPSFAHKMTVQFEITSLSQDETDTVVEQILETLFASVDWCGELSNIESYSAIFSVDTNSENKLHRNILQIVVNKFQGYTQ